MSKKAKGILTKEFLHKEYVTKQKTVAEIASEFHINRATVSHYLTEFSIYRKRKYDNIINKKFGKWLVKDLAESNEHGTIWLCQCECGNEHKIHRHSLTQGKSTQCKSCADKGKISKEEFPISFFTKIVLDAKRRKIVLDITKEYIYNLFLEQDRKCALTNLPIKFSKTNWGHFHKETTASLDRIDSGQGYVKGNVQWVHKDINKIKQGYSQEYFEELCKLVVEHRIKGKAC